MERKSTRKLTRARRAEKPNRSNVRKMVSNFVFDYAHRNFVAFRCVGTERTVREERFRQMAATYMCTAAVLVLLNV